jgi:hypothetical protein
VRGVIHDVLPLDGWDVREVLVGRPEHGGVGTDDGAVAEELDDAAVVLDDARCRVTGHGTRHSTLHET